MDDYKRLDEICTTFKSDILINKVEKDTGTYPLFGAKGVVASINTYLQAKPYISIIKWGAGVGRAELRPGYSSIVATMLGVLPKDGIDIDWLCYLLQSMHLEQYTTNAVVPNLYFKDYCQNKVRVPSVEEQQFIVSTLKRLENNLCIHKKQLQKLDDLVKSRFVEMFGDMLVNPKKWEEQRLDTIASIVSGITKGRKVKNEALFEVPYMAVSNVKDGFIDWTTVKTIMATKAEITQYRLLPEDVLMTEGGDPDKLGRGAIIHDPPKDCIHQNHVFRVRLNQNAIIPVFMAQYLQQQKAKRYFLGCAKQTTGIASINMTQLSALPVLTPPLKQQKEYASFVAQVNESKLTLQKGLDKLELLKQSLMQQYFG